METSDAAKPFHRAIDENDLAGAARAAGDGGKTVGGDRLAGWSISARRWHADHFGPDQRGDGSPYDAAAPHGLLARINELAVAPEATAGAATFERCCSASARTTAE